MPTSDRNSVDAILQLVASVRPSVCLLLVYLLNQVIFNLDSFRTYGSPVWPGDVMVRALARDSKGHS